MAETSIDVCTTPEEQRPGSSTASALASILLLLGETPASLSARRYAFGLARQAGARLSGLAGIDLAFIEARMPGVVGGAGWKAQREKQLRSQADEMRRRLRQTFEEECLSHREPFDWLSFDGEPIDALRTALETRDLMITGHDTAFRGNVREDFPEMLARLLSIAPRPVVVCPDELPGGADVLVAYDGSAPSMRALQLFSLLGLGRGRRIHVVAVDASQERAARCAAGASTYLRGHGYQAEAAPVASSVRPSEVLRIEIADRNIGMFVMGAYGHRGLREFLFGSTTAALVEDPLCSLFIYH
jgi:nucleotide-binding universal stress UspA family protein